MTSAGHTKTPWAIDEENCGDGANIRSQEGRVAWTSALRRIRTGERVIEAAEAKANAAIIVEAVNSHNTLLAAVRFADTRAVSRAAYPHACLEDRQLRDLIDEALATLPGTTP